MLNLARCLSPCQFQHFLFFPEFTPFLTDFFVFLPKMKKEKAQRLLSFSIWNPAVSYSPGRLTLAALRPLGAARAKPSQVLCCTLTGIAG